MCVCAELSSFIDYTIVFLTRFWLISNELLLFRYIVLSFPFYIVELSASYVVHIFVFFHFWAFPIDDIDFGSELIPDMRYHWLSVCKGEKRTNDTESDRGIKLLSQQAAGTIKCYRFSFFFCHNFYFQLSSFVRRTRVQCFVWFLMQTSVFCLCLRNHYQLQLPSEIKKNGSIVYKFSIRNRLLELTNSLSAYASNREQCGRLMRCPLAVSLLFHDTHSLTHIRHYGRAVNHDFYN